MKSRRERAALAYACALLTLYALFLPLGGYERMMTGKYHLFLLLSVGFLILCPPEKPKGPGLWCLGAAYLGFTALSALCSPWKVTALLGGPRREGLLTIALYVLCAWSLCRRLRRRDAGLLLACAAVSAVLCDLLVLVQLTGRNPLWLYPKGLNYYDGDAAYAGFFAGTTGNADFTAFLLALAVCVFAAALIRLRLWVLAGPLALTLYTLWRLGVSTAWAGLFFTALASPALLLPRYRKPLLAAQLLLGFLLLALLYGYRGDNETLAQASALLHGAGDGGFGSGRVAIWRACLPLVRQRPLLGGGPDTLWLRGLEPFSWFREDGVTPVDITAAHNEFLNILVNQGAFALASYLALLSAVLDRCFRSPEDHLRAVCGTALLCYAAMALFSISTCLTAPYTYLLLAAAGPAGRACPSLYRSKTW